MRKTFLLFMSTLARTRMLVLISLAVGALLCVVYLLFASVYGAPEVVKIGYIDNDASASSADLKVYCAEKLGMEVVEGDETFLNNELVEKRISAIIEVPEGFESDLLAARSDNPLLLTSLGDYENQVFITAYLDVYTSSLQVLGQAAQGDGAVYAELLASADDKAAGIEVVNPDESRQRYESMWTGMVATLGFFLIISMFLVQGIANLLLEDRRNGTYQRIRCSNALPVEYVAGVCMAGFVLALLMMVVVVGFLAIIGLGGSLPLMEIGVLCLCFLLVVIGFALVCGLALKNNTTVMTVFIASATIFSLLGGAWFPIEYAPKVMQAVAHITPQFWFMDGVYGMYHGNANAWIPSAGILLLFALLFFLIAAIRFAGNRNAR